MLVWLAVVSCMFGYVLGEAFLFRGVLLPKALGVFGRWAWLANAVLFGPCHVHRIWALPSIFLSNIACSLPAQRFRIVWFAVLIDRFEGVALLAAVAMGVQSPG